MWKIEKLLETITGEIEARKASDVVKAQEIQVQKQNLGSIRLIPTANTLISMGVKNFRI